MLVPVSGMTIEDFHRKSILYTPPDVVHDGLPWFGTARDDWKPGARIRRHTGLDVYADSLVIIAVADGEVTAVGRGTNSGGNITIRHRDSIETMYVHLTLWKTYVGAQVRAGNVIGVITKPEGNAAATQLHWAIRIKGKFINPLPLIRKQYQDDPKVRELLDSFDKTKDERVKVREKLVGG